MLFTSPSQRGLAVMRSSTLHIYCETHLWSWKSCRETNIVGDLNSQFGMLVANLHSPLPCIYTIPSVCSLCYMAMRLCVQTCTCMSKWEHTHTHLDMYSKITDWDWKYTWVACQLTKHTHIHAYVHMYIQTYMYNQLIILYTHTHTHTYIQHQFHQYMDLREIRDMPSMHVCMYMCMCMCV